MLRRLAVAALAAALFSGVIAPTPATAEIDLVNGWDYQPASVGGAYQVVSGQFGGDLATDLFFYGAGSVPDSLWLGRTGERGQASFEKVPMAVGGDYRLVVGDFTGDDYDDILFYGPGTASDWIWTSIDTAAYFDKTTRVSIGGSTYEPQVLHDYRATGAKDDLLFLAPGAAADYFWHFPEQPGSANYFGPGTYQSRRLLVGGDYTFVVGDFSGDRIEDVILYRPGTGPDYRWTSTPSGGLTQTSLRIDGVYQPVVSYQPRYDGVYWWANGGRSPYWVSDGVGFRNGTVPAETGPSGPGGTVRAFGLGGALIQIPGGPDGFFTGDATGGSYSTVATPAHDQTTARPLIGNFDNDGNSYLDVFWYGPGAQADELWYGITPDSGVRSVPTGPGAGPGAKTRATPVTGR